MLAYSARARLVDKQYLRIYEPVAHAMSKPIVLIATGEGG